MESGLLEEMLSARSSALRVARQVTGSHEDAEDCVQAALEVALRSSDDLAVTSPAAWLVAVTRNRALDMVRRRVLMSAVSGRGWGVQPEPDIADLVADRDELRWMTREALRRLPRSTASVLSALASGCSTLETAAKLGLSVRSVEAHVLRLRRVVKGLRWYG